MKALPPRAGERGVALILTLAILVVICILCVTFVSSSSQDRGATKSYAQSLLAEQIGLGGLDQVVSQLQAEIADPLLSTNMAPAGGALYVPLAASNAVPQRMTTNTPSLAALIGYSGTNLYTRGAGATNFGSAGSTLAPSLNGRAVTLAQWALPQLTAATNGFPAPRWILMTRSGPQAAAAYSAALADGTPFNNSYVVGRYAYAVYDTGGLLDVNVAGYPAGAAASAALKGLLPWADLTQLTNALAQADVDKLVAWRNAGTGAAYGAAVYAAATNNGFTRVANQDTAFLGRQDLIKYAQTQLPALTNALPYLTTFSRELNGPTWGPSTNTASFAYAANQYQAASYNPRIPYPAVQGAFTRQNGLKAAAGEPLVKYRFPLSKLALLEKFTGPGSGTLSGAEIDQVQQYFGLDYAPDANGPTFRHWTYPTTNPKYVHNQFPASHSSGIMTLDDVAAQGREPDFFELLQAGMLAGSLQKTGRQDAVNYPAATFVDPDGSATLQVLRTGANIIDQWDKDSYPTTVTFTSGPAPISVYGIEDLPYPFAAFVNICAAGSSSLPTAYLYFELWNPHQAPPATAGSFPTSFRIAPLNNATVPAVSDGYRIGFNEKVPILPSGTKSCTWLFDGTGALSTAWQYFGAASLPFSVPAPATGYREPSLMAGTMVAASGPAPTPPAPLNTVAGFALPLPAFPTATSKANDDGAPLTGFVNPGWQVKLYLHLTMPLQYQDGSGTWRTYATFDGIDDSGATAAYPVGTSYSFSPIYAANTGAATLGAPALVKSDPRTCRLGPGFDLVSPYANTNVNLSSSGGAMNMPVSNFAPFNTTAGVGTATPYRLDMWAANDSAVPLPSPTASSSPYYADIDGVTRWGDARNSYKGGAGSPLFNGANANRPVVLNRPFQSAGDLGYAFRDAPWKTLDFFSPNSADAGLLDLFTLSDSPVVAGRVNPNAAPAPVLAALLAGAAQGTASGSAIGASNAQAAAQALYASATNAPFLNRAELATRFMTNAAALALAPSGIKTEQEAAVRALAESSNTRTWNFLVDIISQTGRYPATAASLDNFVVDGARRYWLHVAIDRYTGQVVDKQIEIVNQ